MACVENVPGNGESEMEEGEIIDDLDDLSDISSEEEFLLRQRLQVLENYNNVLERKKKKSTSFGAGNEREVHLQDLSEISATELDDSFTTASSKTNIIVYRNNVHKHSKPHHKPKRRKDLDPHNLGNLKDYKKKVHRKKKAGLKVISETSDESDDEYRNKRRKLANAVALNRDINDKSSLQDRLQKMLGGKTQDPIKTNLTEVKQTETETPKVVEVSNAQVSPAKIPPFIPPVEPENITSETQDSCELIDLCDVVAPENLNTDTQDSCELIESCEVVASEKTTEAQDACNLIDLCENDDEGVVKPNEPTWDTVDSVTKSADESKKALDVDSDEDLEQLRQHALKSKTLKSKSDHSTTLTNNIEPHKTNSISDDEDSDTAELRIICLKSALLKKAIELKQKQKLRKRLSSFSMQDDFYKELNNSIESDNNTDIESVDMDMGSDADEKGKDLSNNNTEVTKAKQIDNKRKNVDQTTPQKTINDDELEEDEDLLRAKLLTSLSKNLPNLVDPNVIPTAEVRKPEENTPPVPKTKIPENKIIINLGESDSEGEHEATKNLTKMHMKLSEQVDFQQKLDMFLKSTRLEVEKKKIPDVIENLPHKPPEKFVAKTVNHLPKSEQIEYRNLVKKMAELEKMKVARQSAMNLINQSQAKDTLKPRNVSVDTNRIVALSMLEEQVAMSRKKIAEESARMMQLKEEATKLSQKYKIVANELKNISTAITLNKKEQRTVQNRLTKIRLHHQRLFNSSFSKHSKINGNTLTMNRPHSIQKENNPMKDEYKNFEMLKCVKVSLTNDKSDEAIAPSSRLSIQVDVTGNKKVVTTIPAATAVERVVDECKSTNDTECLGGSDPIFKGGGGTVERIINVIPRVERKKEFDEYKSPLQSLEKANWEADPNAILCPFEVGGHCKDPDCKYLHHKVPSQ